MRPTSVKSIIRDSVSRPLGVCVLIVGRLGIIPNFNDCLDSIFPFRNRSKQIAQDFPIEFAQFGSTLF